MRLGEGAGQRDPVLVVHLGIRRQRQHDLAGNLRILAAFRRFRRVPQHAGPAESLCRTLGLQHRMVFRRVAMAKVEQLAGALRLDRLAAVIRRRAHGTAARAAGNVARAGKLDGHGHGV